MKFSILLLVVSSCHGLFVVTSPLVPISKSTPLRSKLPSSSYEEDDDGYEGIFHKPTPLLKQFIVSPLQVPKISLRVTRKALRISKEFLTNTFLPDAKPPGTLILIRHGQSEWNRNKTFTGWENPDLSETGVREVKHAGRLLVESGYQIDVLYTSRLQRAVRSVWIILKELDKIYLPVFKSWRLNERHYGALQGLSKPGLTAELGEEVVQQYRGGLHSRPPPMSPAQQLQQRQNRAFADLTDAQLPLSESLNDCMERSEPLWNNRIKKDLLAGRNVCIVAHGNSLRGIIKNIDNITDSNIENVALPTGIPIIYNFDESLTPIRFENTNEVLNGMGDNNAFKWSSKPMSDYGMNGVFLEQPGLLREALQAEAKWRGSMKKQDNFPDSIDSRIQSLNKLQQERSFFSTKQNGDGEEEESAVNNSDGAKWSLPSTQKFQDYPDVVLVRHGQTEFNKLKIFTGWMDAGLASEGRAEAKRAGEQLDDFGFHFDLVYTSWLSRAIETAWIILDQQQALFVPIMKSWRLNERQYGALQGLSKRMVNQKHGNQKFLSWRRGYDVRPPRTSSFDKNYPGNDERYIKYINDDLRYSWSESLVRSIEGKKISLHRKLPKTESLKDCMERTIPFFTDHIVPDSIANGKRVLIASSENAIRGLLMHLCDIPPNEIANLEIPTGLPIVYSFKSRCIRLLEDEEGEENSKKHNFGTIDHLLFRPCVVDYDLEGNVLGPRQRVVEEVGV